MKLKSKGLRVTFEGYPNNHRQKYVLNLLMRIYPFFQEIVKTQCCLVELISKVSALIPEHTFYKPTFYMLKVLEITNRLAHTSQRLVACT